MKKLIMTIVVMVAALAGIKAQNIFSTDFGHVSFFSDAPIADVDAVNHKVNVELNTTTQELTCAIVMKEFDFKSAKMGMDAGKKYLEIDTYQHASFIGNLTGQIDYDKPGSYPVIAVGKLTIHGVEKQVSEKGTVIVQNGLVKLQSQFNVRLEDYDIDTPTILGQEMADDDVLVTIYATLTERPKYATLTKRAKYAKLTEQPKYATLTERPKKAITRK